MKKIFCLLLATLLICSCFVGCAKTEKTDDDVKGTTNSNTVTDTTDTTENKSENVTVERDEIVSVVAFDNEIQLAKTFGEFIEQINVPFRLRFTMKQGDEYVDFEFTQDNINEFYALNSEERLLLSLDFADNTALGGYHIGCISLSSGLSSDTNALKDKEIKNINISCRSVAVKTKDDKTLSFAKNAVDIKDVRAILGQETEYTETTFGNDQLAYEYKNGLFKKVTVTIEKNNVSEDGITSIDFSNGY